HGGIEGEAAGWFGLAADEHGARAVRATAIALVALVALAALRLFRSHVENRHDSVVTQNALDSVGCHR
ncbi:MAG: hypothetical protein AAF721_30330, partial [Myxococcota bacterium]